MSVQITGAEMGGNYLWMSTDSYGERQDTQLGNSANQHHSHLLVSNYWPPLDEVEATVEVIIFANLRTFEMITFTVYVGYGCRYIYLSIYLSIKVELSL